MSRTIRKEHRVFSTVTTRDKKPWFKPDSTFKKIRKKVRKAREKRAFREEKEIPKFRKEDRWLYL
jgi:hypothetical protein